MKDEAMGISGMRIFGSVRMRVIPSVCMIRSVAISVAAAEGSRGNSLRSCGACEAMADEYAGSGSERDGRGAATSALQARGSLAPEPDAPAMSAAALARSAQLARGVMELRMVWRMT